MGIAITTIITMPFEVNTYNSLQIEKNMIVVTVFLLIMNQTEFRLFYKVLRNSARFIIKN